MKKPKVTRKRWSPQDDKLLKQLFYLKKPYPDIAKQLQRTDDAVRRRVRRLSPLWKLQEQQLSHALSDTICKLQEQQLSKSLADITADSQDSPDSFPSTPSPLRILVFLLASAAFLYLLLR